MTKQDEELAALTTKAEAGDRDAIRELRMRKLAAFSHDRIYGSLVPDANGRIQETKQ